MKHTRRQLAGFLSIVLSFIAIGYWRYRDDQRHIEEFRAAQRKQIEKVNVFANRIVQYRDELNSKQQSSHEKKQDKADPRR